MTGIARVGFVGLGNMGGPMCGHLARAGLEVRAFDLDDAALARAVAAGASAATSAADCTDGAEALITMLPAPPQVEQVLLGDGGVIAALAPGSVAIDMSTSSRAVGERVWAAAADRGVACARRAGGRPVMRAPAPGHWRSTSAASGRCSSGRARCSR